MIYWEFNQGTSVTRVLVNQVHVVEIAEKVYDGNLLKGAWKFEDCPDIGDYVHGIFIFGHNSAKMESIYTEDRESAEFILDLLTGSTLEKISVGEEEGVKQIVRNPEYESGGGDE